MTEQERKSLKRKCDDEIAQKKRQLQEFQAKIAADIKTLKPVEPYKGKGIKERNQYVLRKEGKKK